MQDLSHLADGSLIMDSSMHGGNTVSVNPPFSPEGSESEATQGIETHSRPNIDLGPNNDRQLHGNREDHAGERPASHFSWRRVN